MPRHCVICGKRQSKSFSIFRFPISQELCSKWIDAIRKVNPEFANGIVWKEVGLKNGVCQLHFRNNEFSTGKKCRLHKKAVPSSLDPNPSQIIPNQAKNSLKQKPNKKLIPNFVREITSSDVDTLVDCKSLLIAVENKYSGTSENNQLNSKGYNALAETASFMSDNSHCSIEVDLQGEFNSLNEKITFEKEYEVVVCLICGSDKPGTNLISTLESKFISSIGLNSLEKSLCNLLDVTEENLIRYENGLCPICFEKFIEIFELKRIFNKKLSFMKESFNKTQIDLRNSREYSCFLELEADQTQVINEKGSIIKKPSLEENHLTECKILKSLRIPSKTQIEIGVVHDDNKYNTCPECNRTFTSQRDLFIHTKSQHLYYECKHCGRFISSKARLKFHIYKFHGIGEAKEQCFSCNFCEKSFTTRPGLRYHEQTSHIKQEKYSCELCNKLFFCKILYDSHKLYSHGEKNLVCEKCGDMFFTVSKLNSHLNAVHLNALSWTCSICQKKFTTASAYKHHVSNHHNSKEFICQFCDAKFKKSSSLNKHLWKHDTYFCLKCKINFKKSLSYTLHMLEKHNIYFSKDVPPKSETQYIGTNKNVAKTATDDIHSMVPPLKESISNIVINDILINNAFHHGNQQAYPFTLGTAKGSKAEQFDLGETAEDVSCVVNAMQFENVQSLETVHNESCLKLEQDVTLLNDAILENLDSISNEKLKTSKIDLAEYSNK